MKMKKRSKVLLVIAVILALYVLIPVLSRQAPPFRLFHLNADKVTAIEVVHWGQSVQFDDPEEVTEIVNRLNHACLYGWIPLLPRGGSDYILHIYYGENERVYTITPSGLIDGAAYFADMKFLTTDLFPDEF